MGPKSARRAIRWLERKIVYSVGFGVLVLLAVGAALFYFYIASPPPAVVRIGYGAGGPLRRHFLEQMAMRGKARNIDIQLLVTDGADQTLNLIDQKKAELGLITGAIADHAARSVFEITPLYMEPLQLLVKAPLYDAVSKDFGQLRGKTIGMDGQNSATHLLARELLEFIGLADPATGAPAYHPVHILQFQYAELKDASQFPDAIFQIGGIPSPSIRSLIAARNYRLVALPFGGAFNLDKFREADAPQRHAGATLKLDRQYVEEFIIPEFTYSVLPAVPPTDTRTIASRLILVGGEHLDSHVVHRILDLVLSPEIASLARPELSVDLLSSSFQFERHAGTDAYLASRQPVDVESVFVTYGRLAEVWGIIITLYIFAAKGLKRWRERDIPQNAAVSDFIKQVLEVESAAGASCSAQERTTLDQRLSDIKKTSIELHLDGRLDNAEELPSLLVMLADTRTRIRGPVS